MPSRPTTPASQSATAHGATGSTVKASRAAPTAARALRVLELMAREPERAWKLAEVQRRLDYSHGNLHAIAATLVAMGYLRRDDRTRGYRLGPALLSLGASAAQVYPTVAVAEPHLRRLAEELSTETHAAIADDGDILVVARSGPVLPSGGGVRVGTRIPLTPPLGSTLMAWAPPEVLERYLGSASADLTPEEIAGHRRSLEAVRRRGYSVHVYAGPRRALSEAAARRVDEGVDPDGADLMGLAHELLRHQYLPSDPDTAAVDEGIQLSAPVFGPTGAVEMSVGVAFVDPGPGGAILAKAPELLLATAGAVTAEIGGTAPTP